MVEAGEEPQKRTPSGKKTIVTGTGTSHLGQGLEEIDRRGVMTTGVIMGSTMITEARVIMGSTMRIEARETMGSTMVKLRLVIIVEDMTAGRGQEAQAREDIGEGTAAPDKNEEGGEEGLEEDTAPMKGRRGDTLAKDEETAQGP